MPTQKTDRIMAGQNHAEQRQSHCWQDPKKRGLMILSCHDFVSFLMVAAWPRWAISLSSFGGEGQGQEVVVLSQHARCIGAATRWKVATNRSIGSGDGPPLPDPLRQRRRGRATRPLLAFARCVQGAASSGAAASVLPRAPESSETPLLVDVAALEDGRIPLVQPECVQPPPGVRR